MKANVSKKPDRFSRFDSMPACDGHTDRAINTFLAWNCMHG